MEFTVWHSSESMADFIIDHTELSKYTTFKNKLAESDASKPKDFHRIPDHIKKILYLDAPDIIVELDGEPIFSLEDSKEAGTGHNAFQRFSRLAAAAENKIPSFYIYPEAVCVSRNISGGGINWRWDTLNSSIFKALEQLMRIYHTPALIFYYPSLYRSTSTAGAYPDKGLKHHTNIIKYPGCPSIDPEIEKLFGCINTLIDLVKKHGAKDGVKKALTLKELDSRRSFMLAEHTRRNPTGAPNSPETATEKVPTKAIIDYISKTVPKAKVEGLIARRTETIVYKINANFRGDPYPGCLAALDYLMCREGETFEDRKYNLVMAWGDFNYNETTNHITLNSSGQKRSIESFVNDVKSCEAKNILTKHHQDLTADEIPRYYMQVRYGSMFSKSKHIRVYAYFADAILFRDGALWREG
jgi:hypothetical protein